MKRGIILHDTPYHIPEGELHECDILYGEVSALEHMIKEGRLEADRCGSAVSAFLGAKKNSVKRREILYSAELDIRTILYCIDMKNIRYGELGLFKQEVEGIAADFKDMKFVFYLPIYSLDDTEFGVTLDVLSKTNSSVMISMREDIPIDNELALIVEKAVGCFPAEQVQCCFRSKQESIRAIPVLEAYKIGTLVFYA